MEQGSSKKDDLELWKDVISPTEKIHHELLFFSQGPVDGYLSGEKARDVFLHSRLPLTVLSQIWNLADVSNDNVLSSEEFVLAMHLILKVKEGLPVPRRLPKHLVPSPEPVLEINDVTDIEREAYHNVFNKLNLESIDAIQGRQLLLESKLPVEELSNIWDLSDINRDGQLDIDEWTVSCHLIRNLKKGVKLNGPVDVFKCVPHRLSPISYQARKRRVDEYNRKKHHLMTQKEKRKTQIDNETRRLELLKRRYNLHKELYEVSKTSTELNIPEEEFLLYKEKEENNIERVEAIVYRLKKEHEKIRQETVKVILGEQGSLQEDARLVKREQDDVQQRLLTRHTKATKDPDPFHELYELRKELRKRSTLSEGEEPEVHLPFVANPFDQTSLHPKLNGHNIFIDPSPSVLNNNNSNHRKTEVLNDLCGFDEGFVDKWTSGKDCIVSEGGSNQDSIFMSLNVPMDSRSWSGLKWADNMDTSNIQALHIRLVDLKEEMEKLNDDTGGQLLFRNPDDYLARKRAQEEEEKTDKSKYHRRGASDKRTGKGEKEFKRRSYAAPQRDEESHQALSAYRQKRRSLNLDKKTDKTGDTSVIPDVPQFRSHRRSNIDKKNKENEISVNTKQSETFSPASASSPKPVEFPISSPRDSNTSPTKTSTSPSRPSTKRKAAPPPPQSAPPQFAPPELKPVKQDVTDSPIKQTVEQTTESKIPKFVGVKENTLDNTQPSRPPRRKKKEENKSFLHDSFDKENKQQNAINEKSVEIKENKSNQDSVILTKTNIQNSNTEKSKENIFEKEDTLLDSVIKELPGSKSVNKEKETITNITINKDLESIPSKKVKDNITIARTDNVESEIKPVVISREKGKFKKEDVQSNIKLTERDQITSQTADSGSETEQEQVKIQVKYNKDNIVKADIDEPDGYLDHIKPTTFKRQANVEDIDQAFEKIAVLSDIKKYKDTKDTISIASDISSAGSEPPPLPDSAPPPFTELLPKTLSLTEILETMESSQSNVVEQPPVVHSTDEPEKTTNGELSPVMSPISELKSISMRVTSPTRDKGSSITTNGELTVDVGGEKKTLEYDSDLSDEEGQVQVKSTFTPGETSNRNIPVETHADDGGIQLLSYSVKLHSPNSDQSAPDSAFEDMQSSMTSNDQLSNTLDEIVQEDVVVVETVSKAESAPKVKQESKPDNGGQKYEKPQRSEFTAMPGTKDFVAKAQQFADVVQKPPNMRVKLKREISSPEDLTDDAYLKLEAERRAVISSSTMKKKGVDLTAQYVADEDSQIEPSPASPDDAIQEWRSEISKRANIDWEEKPNKVDLYSQNVIQENENTESVDRESIANLSDTRKQWENILKTSDTTNTQVPQKNKEPAKQVRHWEVKLPTKSKVVPADVVKSRVDTDSESDNEEKMEDPDSVNESAIEREIRLAMEREELLRKEKEGRLQPEAGQNVIVKSAFENREENNNKPTYHEMTEADRGSELKQREEMIQQELLEQKEREEAIRGDKQFEDDNTSQSSQDDENANESIIEREIRLQQERERDLELSRKSLSMSKPQEEQVSTGEVIEEQVVVEEALVDYSKPDRMSPTPVSTPAVSTPDDLSEAEDQPVETRARITYEEAISSPSHEGESLIARELREAREREEELAQQRQRLSGNFNKSNVSSPPVVKQSDINNVPLKPKSEPVIKPTYQNDVSPYKNERRQSQDDSLSSHSTEKSQPKVTTPRSNVKVTFGDKLYNRMPDRKPSPQKPQKRETQIEREIRLARERENEFRVSKGLAPLKDEKKEDNVEEVEQDEPAFQSKRPTYGHQTSNSSLQKFATSRLQKEIDKQTALEKKYREEGKIKSTSEEHVGLVKYVDLTEDKNTPPKRNFNVAKKPVMPKQEPNSEQYGTVEVKTPEPKTLDSPQPKFNRSVSGGGMTFSYRESRHKAESKIEQELREMREREEELRSQRAGGGALSPRNPDSPRSSSNSVENKRSHFEQAA